MLVMTLEHKILTLIDRGVTSAEDIDRTLGGIGVSIPQLIVRGLVGCGAGICCLTGRGVDRLNELDEG